MGIGKMHITKSSGVAGYRENEIYDLTKNCEFLLRISIFLNPMSKYKMMTFNDVDILNILRHLDFNTVNLDKQTNTHTHVSK